MAKASIDFNQLRAPFRHRDFRLLFWAEFIYRTGMFMGFAATALALAKAVGDEPLYLGLFGAAVTLPSIVVAPLAGAFVSQSRRAAALSYVQIVFLMSYVLCAVVLYQGYQGYLFFLVAALVFGAAIAVSSPVLSAILQDVVSDPSELNTANSIAWGTLSIVQLSGGLLGGLVISYVGIPTCYLMSALSSMIAFVILRRLSTTTTQVAQPQTKQMLDDVRLGIGYLLSRRSLMVVILVEALSGFAAFPYIFQLPLLNSYVLGGSPLTYSLLLAAGALGGTAGGVILGLTKGNYKLEKIMLAAIFFLGLGLLLLSFSNMIEWSLFLIFAMNFSMAVLSIIEMTYIQLHADEDKKGMVLGIFMVAHIGMIPFGSFFLYGLLGKMLGGIQVLGVAGLLFLAVFLYCLRLSQKMEFLESVEVKPDTSF